MKTQRVPTLYTSVTKGCVCLCLFLCVWEISLSDIWMKSVIHFTTKQPEQHRVPPSFFSSSLPLVSNLYCSLTSSASFVAPWLYLCVCVCVAKVFRTQHFLQRGETWHWTPDLLTPKSWHTRMHEASVPCERKKRPTCEQFVVVFFCKAIHLEFRESQCVFDSILCWVDVCVQGW